SLGALVTGVDSSEETVKAARKRLPDAALVTASPETLPVELRRKRFDVVYQSWGALAEIQDLAAWADGIASALKKGGILFLYDEHPVAACLDQMLHWHESYFETWPLGRLIHALGGAGLALERLEELPDPNRWGRPETLSSRRCFFRCLVDTHIEHIYDKLGACTRAHAVGIAFRSGVLER